MNFFAAAVFTLTCIEPIIAQTDTSSVLLNYAEELAALEEELATDDLFGLIDSILTLEPSTPPSELNVRMSYSSNVTNGGRDFNFNQYGLSPGISFFHKSGFFADVGGFWNSEFDPQYSITIGSLGYLGNIGESFSFSTSFDKWFFHIDNESEISESPDKSFNTSLEFSKKVLSLGINYSYLFGPSQAHRLSGDLGARWQTKKWIKNAVIAIQPTFTALYGNQVITIQFSGRLIDEIRSNQFLQQNLRSEEFAEFVSGLELPADEQERVENIRNNRFLSEDRKRSLIVLVYLGNDDIREYIYDELETRNDEYGMMNYTFSLPISISFKKYMLLLSYSYNIPVELPGETAELEPLGIFSGTFIYRIPFK